MPRKTGAQKRKAGQTSSQEGQDLAEEYLGKLRRLEDVEAIRSFDSIEEKMDMIKTLAQSVVNFTKSKSDEALGFIFNDVVSYFDAMTSLNRHALNRVPHKDAGRVAELERKVKEQEEEIKRFGDGGLDSEEKLTGLRERLVGKVKEIKELKERVQKSARDFEEFRVVAKAEAEEKDRLGFMERSSRSAERREEETKIMELQGGKERMELAIRDLEGSRRRKEEELVALQQKFEIVESSLHCAQDELGVERTKRAELEVVRKLPEDVKMGGTNLSPRKEMTDAATNTDGTKYAQVAVQERNKPEVPPLGSSSLNNSKGKKLAAHPFGEKPGPENVRAGSGGSRSQEVGHGGVTSGTMTKAIVVHGVSTNWRVSGVADCVEGIMGKVIGSRWLLGAGQRVGKMASSMVVYLDKEVFLEPKAYIRMAGVEYLVVSYRWRK